MSFAYHDREEYCFECMEKHLQIAKVLLGEALQRAEEKGTKHESTYERIRKAITELAGFETDTNGQANEKIQKLNSLARKLRKDVFSKKLAIGLGTKEDIADFRRSVDGMLNDVYAIIEKDAKIKIMRLGIERIQKEDRMFSGWGTVEIKDNQGDIIPISAFEDIMPLVMERGGVIMDSHSSRHVGKILDWEIKDKDGNKGIYLTAEIFSNFEIDDEIWKDILDGRITGFSLGGDAHEVDFDCDEEGCIRRIKDLEIFEWSVVRSPANPEATIDEVNRLAKGQQDDSTSQADVTMPKGGGMSKNKKEEKMSKDETKKQVASSKKEDEPILDEVEETVEEEVEDVEDLVVELVEAVAELVEEVKSMKSDIAKLLPKEEDEEDNEDNEDEEEEDEENITTIVAKAVKAEFENVSKSETPRPDVKTKHPLEKEAVLKSGDIKKMTWTEIHNLAKEAEDREFKNLMEGGI